jgi:hypothetical protein
MKFKYLSLTIFCLVSLNISSQIYSGKTTFKFNNAPALSIENLKFSDVNGNKVADAQENCMLIFSMKNTGKSEAKAVKIYITTKDSLKTYFLFDDVFRVGNIPVGLTKEIRIPIIAAASFEDANVTFELTAREANNYDSKPISINVPVKAANSSLAINWYYPFMLETGISNLNCMIKACIISSTPVTEVEFYLNNKLFLVDRGFKLIKKENCDNYLEQEIKLEEGNNQIQIKAKNKNIKIDSEIRNIKYSKVEYEYRTALVIGNSKYDDAPLRNPSNDARSMAKTLRELQFDVIEIIDGDIATIRQGIRDFHDQLEKNRGVALFYYAGHGVQLKGENYIVPVNHDIKNEYEIPDRAVRIDAVLEAMENTQTRMNIVILDACRNNPFARSFRSGTRGLVPIYAAGSGSIIAYSTAPGSVAADGNGENGLYNQELLKAIKTPGLEIGMVFRTVLTNVKKLSNNQQLPWTNSSIEGEFYFIK